LTRANPASAFDCQFLLSSVAWFKKASAPTFELILPVIKCAVWASRHSAIGCAGWASRQSIDESSPAAAYRFGAVENGVCDTVLDWATFLFEYSAFVPPIPSGPTLALPGMM